MSGVGAMTWSPLACGLITGKYSDGVPDCSRAAMKVSHEEFVSSRFPLLPLFNFSSSFDLIFCHLMKRHWYYIPVLHGLDVWLCFRVISGLRSECTVKKGADSLQKSKSSTWWLTGWAARLLNSPLVSVSLLSQDFDYWCLWSDRLSGLFGPRIIHIYVLSCVKSTSHIGACQTEKVLSIFACDMHQTVIKRFVHSNVFNKNRSLCTVRYCEISHSAWCLRSEGVSSVLLGVSNTDQLIENLGALQVINTHTHILIHITAQKFFLNVFWKKVKEGMFTV